MKYRLRKIDAIIIVALIIIAGAVVLFKTGYIDTGEEEILPFIPSDNITQPPPTPPVSLIPGFIRAVTPEDEGLHFDKIRICREWWYWSAIFDENSGLAGWSIVVSFNHMARSDLLGTLKPDLLVVTLHGPNGEEYGGLINKQRGYGIINPPTLEAKSPGVHVTYEDSWAEGRAPEWHVHVEDNEIDKDHKIIIDLDYFAPSDPFWTVGERAFQKSKSNIASYMFMGCNVTGIIQIDGTAYVVSGTGYHEHSWSPNIVTRGTINGWDWLHMTFDNGWNIYFSNYYPTPQIISSKTSRLNPFGTLIITTNKGRTVTMLDSINLEITESDKRVFLLVKMPTEFSISAKPGVLQPLLQMYNIQLELDIKTDNTYEKVWKFPTYVGMNIGRSTVNGKITWSDDGNQEMNLNGIVSTWSMRALL